MNNGNALYKNLNDKILNIDFSQCQKTKNDNGIFWRESVYNINKINSKENYKAPKEVALDMEDNKILEKYMDSVSQNIRDMEQRLSEDRRESEKRITEERRLSEERVEKRFSEAMKSIELTNNKIDKLESKISDTHKWIIGLCITTIIGIITIAVTVMTTIKK